MNIKLANNANENIMNNRAYNDNDLCVIAMVILTMSSVAVSLTHCSPV